MYRKLFYLMCIVLLCNCCSKKDEAIACFTLEKNAYMVGEEVKIKDCSKFLKRGKEIKSKTLYVFDDGRHLWTETGSTITHTYKQAGEYSMKARIGFPEGASTIEKKIVITE